MPVIHPAPFVEEPETTHPVTGARMGAYAYHLLGDAAGLTQFGAHLERLPPGERSALRHWHEAEDELVYLLEGEVWLIEDDETRLTPGMAVGWPAGRAVGHCLENRGITPALYLTVGTRKADDVIHYPDDGLTLEKTGRHRRFLRGDGTVVAEFDKER